MMAYSYIRWSREIQSKGDTRRRQMELAERWAKLNNVPLDNQTYQDHGVSAFKGLNLKKGRLGWFLKAVDEGLVETPCYLVVESLDRLTRSDILTAINLFTSIIQRGVTIVTLEPEERFSEESVKKNWTQLIIAIAFLVRGNEESTTKGHRIREKWDQKLIAQREGKIVTRACPSWLKPNADLTGWIVDRKKAAAIERIYQLAADGRGKQAISKILNKERVPFIGPRAGTWHSGTVGGLLRTPATMGTFVTQSGEEIKDYYKAVISAKDWYAVQGDIGKRKNSGRYNEEASNLFATMTCCAYCAAKKNYRTLKYTGNGDGSHYLYCRNSMDGAHGCTAKMIRYEPVESDLLAYLLQWMKMDVSAYKLNTQARTRTRELEADILTLEGRKKKYIEATLAAPNVTEYAQLAGKMTSEIEVLVRERNELSANPPSEEIVKDAIKLMMQLTTDTEDSLKGAKLTELRLKVRAALKRQIARIEVAPYLETQPKHWDNFGITDKPEGSVHAVRIVYVHGTEKIIDVFIDKDSRRKKKVAG